MEMEAAIALVLASLAEHGLAVTSVRMIEVNTEESPYRFIFGEDGSFTVLDDREV